MKKNALIIAVGMLLFIHPLSGQTWLPSERLTWTLGYSYSSAIAVDSANTLHVVWHDSTPGNNEIYYKRRTDGGATWTTKRLTYNSGSSERPAIAIDSNKDSHVVWQDSTPGNLEIYYKRSTDWGGTWTTKRLTWNPGSSAAPAIATDSNNHLYVVWEVNTPGNAEIYYKRSTDGGTTWTTKRLTYNSGYSWLSAIAVDSNNYIHVVWLDSTSGNNEIYYKRSTDGGTAWTTKRLTYNSGDSYYPAIATDSNNHIHVVWEDKTPGNPEIYYKRSTDGGATWTAERLTWNPEGSYYPAIAIDSKNNIHIAWFDYTPGNAEIYYKRSTDGGTTWTTKRLTWNPGSSSYPAIAIDSYDHIHVVWEDNTSGNGEIYYRKGIQ